MRLLTSILVLSLGLGAALGYAAGWMKFAGYEERFEVRPPEYRSNPYVPELVYSTEGTPVAVVEGSETHNFGVMSADGTGTHTFVLKNEGTAPLTLTLGQTSCKCTVSGLAKDRLAPGDSAEITLEWTPKAMVREFRQTAPVYTNDPQRSQITFAIEGAVLSDVWLAPEEMSLPDLDPAQERTVEAFLWSLSEQAPKATAELTSERLVSHMSVETAPVTEEEIAAEPGAKSGVKILIHFKRGFPLGPFEQTLKVQTDLPENPSLSMKLRGDFVGDLRIIGPAYDSERAFLDLGEVSSLSGKEAKLNLLVKGEKAGDVEVTFDSETSDPADAFEVEFGEKRLLGNGNAMIPFTLRVKPGLSAMTRLGTETQPLAKVVLKTTHPDYSELPIWVRLSVATDRP